MKNVFLLLMALFCITACNQAPKNEAPKTTTEPTDSGKPQNDPDLAAITDVIHNFYKWYDGFQQKDNKNFINDKGKHVKLDLPKLDSYLANFKNSGFVSNSFIDGEKAFYKKCETFWQKEENEGPPTGMDADKIFCGQDWDAHFFTTSPVSVQGLGTDKVTATLSGTEVFNPENSVGGSSKSQNLELVKENGKWLISKIECDMGVDVSTSATPEQKMIEDLAAFYTGTLPCKDCDAIETLLTLNADAKRTFTLEEQYKGKKAKTIESNGTWSIADGIVTLKGKTASPKYQVTKEGLIGLNADGSKKDAALGKKYLLKKVLGE